MAFGKAFKTLKEANAFCRAEKKKGKNVTVRKLSKKLHPRRIKRFHVGTEIDFLNFA